MRKRLGLLSILIALSVIFTACKKINIIVDDDSQLDNAGEVVTRRDTVNIPLKKLSSLNPLESKEADYYNFSKLIYQSLFEFNKEERVIPLLVEEYKILGEGKVVEFELKEGIKWHNGEELSTSDVEFTIEMLKGLDKNTIYYKLLDSAIGNFDSLAISKSIDLNIIDSRNATIVFNKTYGNNLEALTFPILNEASYDEEFKPIGTGPYKFIDYNGSEGIKLEKNSDYWDGEVAIENINGKLFDNDSMVLKAFQDRRVDFASGSAIDLKEYSKDSNAKMLEYISPEYEFLSYNLKNNILSGEEGKQIRQAIYYGIDIQSIIADVYQGHATQTDTPIRIDSFLAEDVERFYGYSMEKATSILESIGFKYLDKEGVLTNLEGEKLEFRLVTNFLNDRRKKIAKLIKKDLEKVGINIILDYPLGDLENVDRVDQVMLDQEWDELNSIISYGNYDLAVLGWETSVVQDISFMFHSSYLKKGTNINFYNDGKIDNLLSDMYFSRRDRKVTIAKELQEYIMEELPYGSLFFENGALLMDRKIKGPLEPDFHNLYRGLEKCKIESVKD